MQISLHKNYFLYQEGGAFTLKGVDGEWEITFSEILKTQPTGDQTVFAYFDFSGEQFGLQKWHVGTYGGKNVSLTKLTNVSTL